MDKGENGEQIGSVGIRAYLYIKPEYDETEEIKSIAESFEDEETKGLVAKYEEYKEIWEKEYNEKKEEIKEIIIKAKSKDEAITLQKEQNEKLRYWFITEIRPIIEEQMRIESVYQQQGAGGDVPGYTREGKTGGYYRNGRNFAEYKQINPVWSYKSYGPTTTIGSSGCNVTSIAIVASGYGYTFTPAKYSSKYYIRTVDKVRELFPNIQHYITTKVEGKNVSQAPNSWDISAIRSHLKTGEPVIIHVLAEKYGISQDFSNNQHWMVLLDIKDSRNKTQVYVSDPNGRSDWFNIVDVLQGMCCYILVKGPSTEMIQIANDFYKAPPVSWEYYGTWGKMYEQWKLESKELILNTAQNKEQAQKIANQEKNKINNWVKSQIKAAKKR